MRIKIIERIKYEYYLTLSFFSKNRVNFFHFRNYRIKKMIPRSAKSPDFESIMFKRANTLK